MATSANLLQDALNAPKREALGDHKKTIVTLRKKDYT